MKYSNQWLLDQRQKGTPLKYLYFWGHQKRGDGVITASCLSQWYLRGFDYEGHHYASAEHWMMAGKARLFNDEEMLAKILASEKPAVAKKLGRQVRNFKADVWEAERTRIVAKGSYLKFKQHPDLLEFLLTTGDKVLVEASPFDRIWGIGMSKDAAEKVSPDDWKGENWLGWCLIEARDALRVS